MIRLFLLSIFLCLFSCTIAEKRQYLRLTPFGKEVYNSMNPEIPHRFKMEFITRF